MMDVNDRILGAPRGSEFQFWLWAGANHRTAWAETDAAIVEYIGEAFRLSPLVGIDPTIVIAQSALETDAWTSPAWRERLNPAGIGITDGPDYGYHWDTGIDAARGQIIHLMAYVYGGDLSWPLQARTEIISWGGGQQHKNPDPRYEAVFEARWAGTVRTIADLTGKWATDPRYAEKIVARGNAIFPGIPDQEGEAMQMNIDLVSRPGLVWALRDPEQAWVTIHNNGNPRSDRFDEREFVANGGGEQGVAYHFAVDAGGVMQIMHLWRQGVHAGNADGNAMSVAIEMCVGSEPWAAVKEHTAQLLAALVRRNGGLDWSGAADVRFSLDRIDEHRDWPGANPACPARLIAEDGGAGQVIARAREILAGDVEPEPIYPREPIPAPDERRAQGHVLTINASPHFRCVQGGRLKTAPSRDAPDVAKPTYRAGRVYLFDYATEVDGEWWLVSKRGSWAISRNFVAVT